MKRFHLPLVVALASLGLAACDVRVNPPENTSTASAPAAQPAAPVDATPAPVQPSTESAATPAPADGTSGVAGAPGAAPADASAAGTAPATPGAPDTTALGASAPGSAMPMETDGVAAPTELSRFLEENAARQAAQQQQPAAPQKAS